jgi:outer membrane protein
MRYFNRLILVIIILSSFINASISKENIGFVNVDYLIQNSNIGKKLLANINDKDKKNLDNLKKKNKILQDLESSIKKKEKCNF